jgi:acyl carrier protein
MDQAGIDGRIRRALGSVGGLMTDPATLEDDADLYDAGLKSLATLSLVLALEDEFGVEFPDRLLQPRMFASVAQIRRSVNAVTCGEAEQANGRP